MSEEKKEQKDKSEENKKRVFLALAVLLGSEADSYEKVTEDKNLLSEVQKRYESNQTLQKLTEAPERISEQQIQTEMAKTSIDDGHKLMRVVTVGDDRVCPKCKEWQGKTVSVDGNDTQHPSVQDFIKSGGLHYGCRCSLQELSTKEIPRKQPNPRAYNSCIQFSQLVFN